MAVNEHEEQLAKVRAWFASNSDWVRLTALAKRLKVPVSTLHRAVSSNPEQQRNVEPQFLNQILSLLNSLCYAKSVG
jgi:hypothetical protein